jgi:hypothetical protein
MEQSAWWAEWWAYVSAGRKPVTSAHIPAPEKESGAAVGSNLDALKNQDSTRETDAAKPKKDEDLWWAVQDSNLRPPACKAGALTS